MWKSTGATMAPRRRLDENEANMIYEKNTEQYRATRNKMAKSKIKWVKGE